MLPLKPKRRRGNSKNILSLVQAKPSLPRDLYRRCIVPAMRIFGAIFGIGLWFLADSPPTSSVTRQPVTAENGMVVTSQHEASAVGVQILRQGGNAIDAAVAVVMRWLSPIPVAAIWAAAVSPRCTWPMAGISSSISAKRPPRRRPKPCISTSRAKSCRTGASRANLAVAVPGSVLGLEYDAGKIRHHGSCRSHGSSHQVGRGRIRANGGRCGHSGGIGHAFYE